MSDQTKARNVKESRDTRTTSVKREVSDLKKNSKPEASSAKSQGVQGATKRAKVDRIKPQKPKPKSSFVQLETSESELSDDSEDEEDIMDSGSDSDTAHSAEEYSSPKRSRRQNTIHLRRKSISRSRRQRKSRRRCSQTNTEDESSSDNSNAEDERQRERRSLDRITSHVNDLEDRIVDLNLRFAETMSKQPPQRAQIGVSHQDPGVMPAAPISVQPPQPPAHMANPILHQTRLQPIFPPPARLSRRSRSPTGLSRYRSPSQSRRQRSSSRHGKAGRAKTNRSKKPAFKRVDWVWDTKLLTYKLRDSAKAPKEDQYEGFVFHVKRSFDHQGKYRYTSVEIKSPILRDCLKEVVGESRGLNLVEQVPRLNPESLFLYYDDLLRHYKKLKKTKAVGKSKAERKSEQKGQNVKAQQLKVLLRYLQEDFAELKEQLDPMLRDGIITYDLLWALWKPNTLAFTNTYGDETEPRVFKVDLATRHITMTSGDYYYVDGTYFEWNGKKFGHGALTEQIVEWRGTRKITSLPCYPLQYHKNEPKVREQLIERGKKFVSLSGVHYQSYSGMAYQKTRKGEIVKFNTQQSRIMIDTATFRRINPNYTMPCLRIKTRSIVPCGYYSDDEFDDIEIETSSGSFGARDIKVAAKIYNDGNDADGSGIDEDDNARTTGQKEDRDISDDSDEESELELSDEDYLLASPVLLGFSFAEKQWLEFKVSSVQNIEWNDEAWDSLVLEEDTKDLIQALVKARKYHGSQTIDDVIRGKGKGLVTVLHGPPGTGKTLTAEGISELLKCPLYAVSAGELGTDSRYLEHELQRILDICHTWGAILLLDEADVFLEKRNMQDIHRNALVSIFLRQLEYFQGILFLTTNRVETFDDAFRSRIHIALRYDSLDAKAKRTIFKMFLSRVVAHGKLTVDEFSDEDYNQLAKHELNGREIKNVVSSAQDLAVNKGESLSIKHLQQVLDVHSKFRRDLNGGTGFEDAMRSYF